MSANAIEIEGLGKRYRIGAVAARHDNLREAIVAGVRRTARRVTAVTRARAGQNEAEMVWALRDVSFTVAHGDVVGLIGRNGAGKSTLLKILSRITEPTTGRVRMYGRVGALLEVGTGFHPELTGRENVFLNGSILGMDRAYIARQFDAIVAFSGVERFIDTPVKRYSSGMYLRLAFAVAAHLEPDILVVDEILAVGDLEFQKQCLGKMSEVASHGRTVLFVSHSMAAIQTLCTRGVLLDQGRVCVDADVTTAVRQYQRSAMQSVEGRLLLNAPRERPEHGRAIRIAGARLVDERGGDAHHIEVGQPLTAIVDLVCHERVRDFCVGLAIDSIAGAEVTVVESEDEGQLYSCEPGQELRLRVRLHGLALNTGEYFLRAGLRLRSRGLDLVRTAHFFEIVDSERQHAGHYRPTRSLVRCDSSWEPIPQPMRAGLA